jgi:hypothetical protein
MSTKDNKKHESPTFGNTLLADASSVMEMLQRDFIQKASKDFDNHLKNYVIKNLKELGFEFSTESDFIDFVSKRVHRIGFENRPNEWELYVDYQTENQKLIGLYNDNVSFSYEGSKVTATFARSVS